VSTAECLETQQRPTSETSSALTEAEILDRYSDLLWSALVAFATDPEYLTEICNAANMADHKKVLFASHAEERRRLDQLFRIRESLGKKVRQDGECWSWTAATTKGTPTMKRPGTQQSVTARAWTVEQWFGPDASRWMVKAECGTALCVNPTHSAWRHVQRSR